MQIYQNCNLSPRYNKCTNIKLFKILLGVFDLVFADTHKLRDMPKLTGPFLQPDFDKLPNDRSTEGAKLGRVYRVSQEESVGILWQEYQSISSKRKVVYQLEYNSYNYGSLKYKRGLQITLITLKIFQY